MVSSIRESKKKFNSTVKREKLSLFGKGKTFVTHEFEEINSEEEGSSLGRERKVRVEESDIVQRNLDNMFVATINNQFAFSGYSESLAVEVCSGMLVCIKKVQL